MNYQITSDNIQISPSMEELTKEKFTRVEHRLRDVPEGSKTARIVLNTAPEGTFSVKTRVVANGVEYFSEETDFTLEGALIKAVEEMVNMIEKKKEIRHRKDSNEVREEMLKLDVDSADL